MRILTMILCLIFGQLAWAEVSIDSPWVRLLPPNIKTTAAYMDLTSDQNDVLLGVTSPVALMVEMHESSMEDGVMSMDRVSEIILPASQKVSLAPHGLHLMIMGLTQVLKEGESVPLLLNFEVMGEVEVNAIVTSM